MLDKKKQGKQNRAAGKRFEVKIREDLEKKGWIVDRWTNNVIDNKLVPCKPKFNPFTHSLMMMSGGFPDFIAFQFYLQNLYEVIGIECKSNGQLDKTEKLKCKWLLKNNIFGKILVARRGKKRGKIIYEKFKNN